jgi:small subunit ribosomal protein S9
MVEDERREPRDEESPQPTDEQPSDDGDQEPAAEAATEGQATEGSGDERETGASSDEPETEATGDERDTDAAGGEPAAPPAKAAEPQPTEDEAAEPKRPARGRERRGSGGGPESAEQPEVVPGADLEPDLVLDEPGRAEELDETAAAQRYAEPEADAAAEEALPTPPEEAPPPVEPTPAPTPRSPRELAADARYQATGKRKTAVARVILKPGDGTFTVNGRGLDQFFPRHGLRATARQPLAAAGYESRMDVVARLHGGGVSSQAGALRHGVARALVEADPALREELKRRGFLTRDPRAKERKKAGLKKARKRPQFSKR